MKKNILFIHSSSEMYGSDRSLYNIVKYLNKEKYNIFVFLPDKGALADELKKIPNVSTVVSHIAVIRRKNMSLAGACRYIKDFFDSYQQIKNYIRKNNIQIVYTNTSVVFPGAVAAKRMKIMSVWHIREIISKKSENMIISGIVNKYADVIVVNSKSTGRSLAVKKKKIKVIYNAIEEKDCIEKEYERRQIVVGMAGRINRWKGQKLFVDAAEIVHKKHPELIFKIAGDPFEGEEYMGEQLESYIKEKKLEKNVILAGRIEDMDSFYQSLDIFVLPSIRPEPFGLVVIEAMQYGIPVIATNHGGPTEIIQNGQDGYLVDFNNAGEMADRIIYLTENPDIREYIGKNAIKKEKKFFSMNSMVKNIEKIFDGNMEI